MENDTQKNGTNKNLLKKEDYGAEPWPDASSVLNFTKTDHQLPPLSLTLRTVKMH